MSTYNSSRYTQFFAQQQTAFTAFNGGTTWSSTNSKLIRIDQGSLSMDRIAPYSRFPVLTGTRSEVAGIRGRKSASWSIRNMPVIPSGTAGTAPDSDMIWQCMFGQPSTGSGVNLYSFLDTGYLPMSLFAFVTGSTTLTSRALWGAIVEKCTFNFNGLFVTADLSGIAGYEIDNIGFSVFDSQAVAGLTSFPIQPSSGAPVTVAGTPIAGFGNGYTATFDAEALQLKLRVLSVTIETGLELVQDVLGSPYPIAVIGNTRRVSINFNALDDDSAALNDIKTKADTDNVTINSSIVAGPAAGSLLTVALNNIQPNAFNLKDNGATVDMEFPTSYAHASAPGDVNDATIQFS